MGHTNFKSGLLLFYDSIWMGSFTSSHKILNDDTADEDVQLGKPLTWLDLQRRCDQELVYHPPKMPRRFHRLGDATEDGRVRVMQWNVLAQALAVGSDNFVACPPDALSWHSRRWRILEEIVRARPDVMCFQEVDHYQFLKRTLGALGFRGIFFPKPDSPCYYIAGNNGPDGCAIFFDEAKFELVDVKTRSLEVWGYQSNQVAILCVLKRKSDGVEFCVATTHLKARQGTLLATMRYEQGKDLMEFIKLHAGRKPVILTGDFNATPNEPVYRAVTHDELYPMDSAYRYLSNNLSEPLYTTWKIREDGECCQTLDYIFFCRDSFSLDGLLLLPSAEDVGEGRVPSYRYPSDHFSLVADFTLSPDSLS